MSKLTRREIASVCVARSCDDILAYVEKRVAPSHPGEKRPRFSLYLSAQLMFGLVRVYDKQSCYLLSDACTLFCRVRTMPEPGIDLTDLPSKDLVTQPEIDLETALVIETVEETSFSESVHSNGTIKQQFWGLSSASERSSSTSSSRKDGSTSSRKDRTRAADLERPVAQASIDQITLVDPPPVIVNTPLSPIPIPRELDLPPLDPRELELLLENVPEPRLSVSDLMPPVAPDQPGHDKQTKSTTESGILEEPKEQTPARRTTRQNGDVPSTRAVTLSPGVTQQIITSPLPSRPTRPSFQLELIPVTPSPSRKRQRKQLVFADKETQIPKTEMRNYVMTSQDTTRNLGLIDLHDEQPEAMLKRPSTKRFRPDVSTGLWNKAAVFKTGIPEEHLPTIDSPDVTVTDEREAGRGQNMTTDRIEPRETSLLDLDMLQLDLQLDPNMVIPDISDIQTDKPPKPVQQSTPFVTPADGPKRKRRKQTLEESMEKLRKTGASSDLHGSGLEMPSMEQVREQSTSRLEISANLDDTLILDDSRKSRSASKRPRSSRSSERLNVVDPVQTTSMTTQLYDLPEESLISNQSLLEHDPDFFLSKVTKVLTMAGDRAVTFSDICPPNLCDRKTAARNFTALLSLAATRQVQVRQEESFDEIYIMRCQE